MDWRKESSSGQTFQVSVFVVVESLEQERDGSEVFLQIFHGKQNPQGEISEPRVDLFERPSMRENGRGKEKEGDLISIQTYFFRFNVQVVKTDKPKGMEDGTSLILERPPKVSRAFGMDRTTAGYSMT